MKRLLFLTAFALVGCSDSKSSKISEPPSTPVHTASVEMRDVPLYFEAIGIIKAHQTVEVKPQVTGIIKKIHFTEGSFVKEGDILYTIDEATYAIRVQETQAHLLQELANLKNAQKKLERYESLYNQDLIPKLEWDELETKVALCNAMVKAGQAKLESAKLDLMRCKIVAPISGKIGKSSLHAGNMVTQETLVTIVQPDPLSVDFTITEKELQALSSSSNSIEIYALGSSECLANGELVFLDHSVDPKSGMLAAKGQLSKATKPVWSGQSVRVHLIFGKKENAKLIPLQAVKTNQGGSYVFSVKEDKTVEMKSVKLGPEERGFIVVEEGLESSEKVVTEGHSHLFPGSKIEEVAQ